MKKISLFLVASVFAVAANAQDGAKTTKSKPAPAATTATATTPAKDEKAKPVKEEKAKPAKKAKTTKKA
ncbi:MAG: signal peptidase [Bacteroidetes bacterium]|nr:signal peptidase [Bacteroidota bacterium]